MTFDKEKVDKAAREMARHSGWDGWDSATNFCHTPNGNDPDDERDYWRGLAQVAIEFDSDAQISSAARDVLAERRRQIEVEGWTAEHDGQYVNDELSRAAACYAMSVADSENTGLPQSYWPWDMKWWKPEGERRNLVKAAALILAEIERLDRAALSASSQTEVKP